MAELSSEEGAYITFVIFLFALIIKCLTGVLFLLSEE